MTDHHPGGHIGARLRDIRRSRSLTLRDVEELSGGQLTAGAVGSYERGVRVISVEGLLDLCALYECAPHDVAA